MELLFTDDRTLSHLNDYLTEWSFLYQWGIGISIEKLEPFVSNNKEWLQSLSFIDGIKKDARVLQTHDVYFLIDKIEPLDLKKMFFIPSATIHDAINNAKRKCE